MLVGTQRVQNFAQVTISRPQGSVLFQGIVPCGPPQTRRLHETGRFTPPKTGELQGLAPELTSLPSSGHRPVRAASGEEAPRDREAHTSQDV